jgi:hypothetical protein
MIATTMIVVVVVVVVVVYLDQGANQVASYFV